MILPIAIVATTPDAACQPRPAADEPAFAALLDIAPPVEEEPSVAEAPPAEGLPPLAVVGGGSSPVVSGLSGAASAMVPVDAAGGAARLPPTAAPAAVASPVGLAGNLPSVASQSQAGSPTGPEPSAAVVDPDTEADAAPECGSPVAAPAAPASSPSAADPRLPPPSASAALPTQASLPAGEAVPVRGNFHAAASATMSPVLAPHATERSVPERHIAAPGIGDGWDAIPNESVADMTRVTDAAPGGLAEAPAVPIGRLATAPYPVTAATPDAPLPVTRPTLEATPITPTPAASSPILPLRSDIAAAQAIARHLLAADPKGGGSEVRFRLAPGTIGTVEVRVENRPGGIEVRLLADTPTARDHLAAQSLELRQLLDAVQASPVAVRVELRPERDAGGGPWQGAAHDRQPPEQRRRHAFRASQDLTEAEGSGAPTGRLDRPERIDRRI